MGTLLGPNNHIPTSLLEVSSILAELGLSQNWGYVCRVPLARIIAFWGLWSK